MSVLLKLYKKSYLLSITLQPVFCPLGWMILHLYMSALEVFFIHVGPPKESIFLTTIYGLYFRHHYTNTFYKLHFFHSIEHNKILFCINAMLCLKVNSNTIELIVHNSCFGVLDLHCVTREVGSMYLIWNIVITCIKYPVNNILVRMIYLTQTSAHDVHFKFEYVVTDT